MLRTIGDKDKTATMPVLLNQMSIKTVTDRTENMAVDNHRGPSARET